MNDVTTTVTSARSYSADGTLNSQTWGNGKVETRTYDLQGRLTQLNVGTDTRRYTYDANGNVTQKVSAPETGNYTYDMLDRLTADNNGINTTFGYDANGNRTLLGSTATSYTANSNRLTQAGPTVPWGIQMIGVETAQGFLCRPAAGGHQFDGVGDHGAIGLVG